MDGSNEIKIPIKAIIENAMEENDCNFDDEEVMFLREYFIACLNLSFLNPDELDVAVSKFVDKIKSISYGIDFKSDENLYYIEDEELTVSFDLYENDEVLFKINFFKAVTEVIFDCVETDNGFSNAICNLVAEYVFNMITEDSRIIFPKLQVEKIGDVELDTCIGGHQLNVIMSLVKQMFISQKINEKIIVREMFLEGYDNSIGNLNEKGCIPILVKMINKIYNLQSIRCRTGEGLSEEIECIENYQSFVNYLFSELGVSYGAFLALVTSSTLREKLLCEKLNRVSD